MWLSGTAVKVELLESSERNAMAGQLEVTSGYEVTAGGNYGRPLNNCEDGCDCNTDEQIVAYDGGKVRWAVCADTCNSTATCPPMKWGYVTCKPLGRCFIKCFSSDWDCPRDAWCKPVQLGPYRERLCMYDVR
ncbi:hypothetical protein FOZ62_011953 [Perkinsus olseni]|uniref:Uncharacterized protein n=1 Tax=Perkinsus olseni TaxID=32597 RepID=A0A7J6S9D7_PEROL|nr:hypothetical protein FOZ62_011953 [Perkinsus olseni]